MHQGFVVKGVMLDLETMGDGSNAAITAIGAVEFDSKTNVITGEFYNVVSLQSSMLHDGVVDASTIIWWMQQGIAAKGLYSKETQETAYEIDDSLENFSDWFGDRGRGVWGNGASFDNPILANAYKRAHLNLPWGFWNDRCYRTLKALHKKSVPADKFIGTKHNALSDAGHQAIHLMKILNHMGL